MLELILVRHGETDSNKRGSFCGWTDAMLNEKGKKQAEEAAQRLLSIVPDVIYSSPLARTLQTAEIVNRNYNSLNIIINDNLKERNCGKWEDMTYTEVCSRYPEERVQWEKDLVNYCIDGGESSFQVYTRANEFIQTLQDSHKSGKVMVVTHLGWIQAALAGLLGMGIEGIWRFRVDNCGISRVLINDDSFAYLVGLNI